MGICSLWLFFPLVSQRKLHFEARQVLGKSAEARAYLLPAAVLWVLSVNTAHRKACLPSVNPAWPTLAFKPRSLVPRLLSTVLTNRRGAHTTGLYARGLGGWNWVCFTRVLSEPRPTWNLYSVDRWLWVHLRAERLGLSCWRWTGQLCGWDGLAVALTELIDPSSHLKSSTS